MKTTERWEEIMAEILSEDPEYFDRIKQQDLDHMERLSDKEIEEIYGNFME